MMKFDISSNRVSVDPGTLMLAPMREIWERDRTRLKAAAVASLSFIHMVSQVDPDAPYYTADENEVRELAAKDVWGDGARPRLANDCDEIVEAYRKAHETPETRMTRLFNKKIDQFQKMIDEVEPEITQKVASDGSISGYNTNANHIITVMKSIAGLIEEKEKLEAIARRNSVEQINAAGGKKPSRLEKKHQNG